MTNPMLQAYSPGTGWWSGVSELRWAHAGKMEDIKTWKREIFRNNIV
jgi:hypothetical protein